MRHRAWAMALLALALMMRAMVPAGYMTQASSHELVVQICSNSANSTQSTYRLAIPSKEHGSPKHGAEHAKATCAFSSLNHAALGGADPILLAIAFLFILALGFQAQRALPLGAIANVRPPVRGPPCLI